MLTKLDLLKRVICLKSMGLFFIFAVYLICCCNNVNKHKRSVEKLFSIVLSYCGEDSTSVDNPNTISIDADTTSVIVKRLIYRGKSSGRLTWSKKFIKWEFTTKILTDTLINSRSNIKTLNRIYNKILLFPGQGRGQVSSDKSEWAYLIWPSTGIINPPYKYVNEDKRNKHYKKMTKIVEEIADLVHTLELGVNVDTLDILLSGEELCRHKHWTRFDSSFNCNKQAGPK